MSGNLLVINVDIREIRVALIENGIIAELHIERLSSRNTAGNIYLGKVSRVLPGMQAAFIDIGEERAAFLHVEDLIRPADFDAILRGEDPFAPPEEEPEPEIIEVEVPDELEAAAAPKDGEEADGEEGADKAPAKPRRTRRKRRARTTKTSVDAADVETKGAADAETTDKSADEGADGEAPDDADSSAPRSSVARSSAPPSSNRGSSNRGSSNRGSSSSPPSSDGGSSPPPSSSGGGSSVPPSSDRGSSEPPDSDSGSLAPPSEPPASEAPASKAAPSKAAPSKAAPSKAASSKAASSKAASSKAASSKAAPSKAAPSKAASSKAAPSKAAPVDPKSAAADAADEKPPTVPKRVRGSRTKMARSRKKASTRTTTGAGSTSKRSSTKRSTKRTSTRSSTRSGSRNSGSRNKKTSRGRGRNNRTRPVDRSRIPKDTPIREVVREGQEVVVQVTKEPLGSKGARVSSHMTLPGRYVVYMPTGERVGISKRIGSDAERSRLREAIDTMKPPTGGLVVRTVAVGLTKKQLKNDVGYLVRLWNEIGRAREEAKRAPALLYEELDLVLKTARDLFSEDVGRVVIDNREQYVRLSRFVEMFMPERAADIELYEGTEPVFDAYGIEDEISRALSRKVPLASGGHLVIDQAEALTAIDVNTGRFVGKGSKDLEETILATNLEAVEEIAYQLRFRNIGGLIILDLIDMDRHANREKVRHKLATLLANDKAKTTINRISDLGLIEMTRKRTRESLGRLLHEACFYCDGTGQLMSRETVAYEILRQIRREQGHLKGYKIQVNAHPAVIDLLKVEEREAVQEAERLFTRRIELIAQQEYHIEQFDLAGA